MKPVAAEVEVEVRWREQGGASQPASSCSRVRAAVEFGGGRQDGACGPTPSALSVQLRWADQCKTRGSG